MLTDEFVFQTLKINRRGEIIHILTKQAQYFTEDLGDGVSLDLVYIPGGVYLMGSLLAEDTKYEKPQHKVEVLPFFMSKYPITQAQWTQIASLPKIDQELKLEPAFFKGKDRPVERVNWYEAVEWCKRLAKQKGREYRLPTEEEWEYACRAGSTTPFHFGETLTRQLANYSCTELDEPKGNHRMETTPVGQFLPNDFGLYDMHGNVWEWCVNLWHIHEYLKYDNPYLRVQRGGSWNNDASNCRSSARGIGNAFNGYNDDGVRIVLSAV